MGWSVVVVVVVVEVGMIGGDDDDRMGYDYDLMIPLVYDKMRFAWRVIWIFVD